MALELSEKQRLGLAMLSDPAKTRILFTGGSRAGKTILLIEYLIQRCYQFPGSRHLIVRKHMVDARGSIWSDTLKSYLEKHIPEEDYTLNKQDHWVNFANGSEIRLCGLDDGARSTKILGTEFTTIYCNEAVEIQYDVVNTLITRLAQKVFDADGNQAVNKLLLDCNPTFPRHWLKVWAIDLKDPSSSPPRPLKNPEEFASLHFTPLDNIKHLPDGYIEGLDALPYLQRERMLFGRWVGGEGAIFRDFNEAIHVIHPFAIPKHWACSMAIDFGFDHPAGILWCAHDFATDSLYVYREFKESNRTIDELAEIIVKYSGSDLLRMDAIWADHDLSDRSFLRRRGIITRPAKKSVLDGIMAINHRLRVNAKTGRPRLFIFDTCPGLIDEMYSYEWHQSNSQVSSKEAPIKLNDDLIDPLRYIVFGLDKVAGTGIGLI